MPSETARAEGRQDGGLDAFISYSHRDAGFVHHLKDALEAGGHVVWIDADDIPVGAPWREELGSGIAAADAFVFVISPESAASGECAIELARALELGKRLVPVLLREVEAIPSGLTETQYVDATSLDAASTANRVGDAIDTDHEWVREHTQWLARALRWQAHDRHKGYLLRGGELRAAEDWLARQSERHKPAPTQLQTEFVVAGRDGEKGRLRRLLIGALASVLLFAGLAAFALVQRNEAIAQRDRAKSRELAAASFSQISVDPELSVLLGVEAMNVDETPQARDALRRALVDSRVRATLHAGGSVTDIAFNTAGDLVAATSDNGVVALVDAAAATELRTMGRHEGPVRGVSFAPGGQDLLTWGDDSRVRLWSVGTGDELVVLPGDLGAVSPDGDIIVTGVGDGSARIFDSVTGAELQRVDVDQPLTSIDFSRDGQTILMAEGTITELGAPGAVVLWQRANGAIAFLGTYGQPVFAASFDADGRRALTVAADVTSVWEVDSGRLVAELGMNTLAEFSPDGTRILAASNDGAAHIWSAEGQQLSVLRAPHGGPILDAAWSSDGSLVVTAGIDQTARVWDPSTGEVLAMLRGHTDSVAAAAFSPDGRTVATAGSDNDVRLWEFDRSVVMRGHDAMVTSVSFSPDGERVVTASNDATARIWDAETGAEILDPPGCERISEEFSCFTLWSGLGHQNLITEAEFGPDGTLVLTAGRDGTAQVWDAATGENLAEFTGHDDIIWRASFDDDASRAVTASADGTARIWEVATSEELVVLRGHEGTVTDAVFSPDGELVVTSGADNTVRLWDATSGDALRILATDAGAVGGIGFSPDGGMVVAPADDTAEIIDIDEESQAVFLRGHEGLVTSASFSSDGSLIVTGGLDGTVRVWHSADGTEARQPFEYGANIAAVAFSPDGTRIAIGFEDSTARISECEVCVPDDQLLTLAEARAARRLTPAERQRYLAGDSQ